MLSWQVEKSYPLISPDISHQRISSNFKSNFTQKTSQRTSAGMATLTLRAETLKNPQGLGCCGSGKIKWPDSGKSPKVARRGCSRPFGTREQKSQKGLLHHQNLVLHWCNPAFHRCKTLRAQRLTKIQDRPPGLKFSIEIENFNLDPQQTPIFVGKSEGQD